MKHETALTYADFAEYDRRLRGVERHILIAFFAGVLIGAVGMLIDEWDLQGVIEYFDPYAYLALSVYVGATARGFGWALLTTFLSAAASLVSGMGVMALNGNLDLDLVQGGPTAMNLLLGMTVAMGLLGYLARRPDGWGDLGAGLVAGLPAIDVVDRATPGFLDYDPAFWPLPALVVGLLAFATVFLLRPDTTARLRALAIAMMVTGVAGMALVGL